MPTDDTIRELRALFPALDWRGDGHTPDCSTIRFSGSRGPDPEPPDPCTCAGPAVLDLLDTLSASRAAGLDVERLTEALRAAFMYEVNPAERRAMATAVAAAYEVEPK